jgi:hypothetical protein
MTGRQEYDRMKDRQRTLDEYMIDTGKPLINFPSVSGAAAFGYLTFGSRVSDDIISNYSASSPTVLIALIGKQIFVTHVAIISR